MALCKVDIRQEESGLTSVKLDGKEMGQYLTGFRFIQEGHGVPILQMDVAAEGFTLASKCILDIPEPYKGLHE